MSTTQWTPLADTYLPAELRDQFAAEAEQSEWKPVGGQHPMMPALGLQEAMIPAMAKLGVRSVSHIAYSQGWTMREDNYQLEPAVFDGMIYASILGVRSQQKGVRFYGLDLGTGIAPVLLVTDGATAGPE